MMNGPMKFAQTVRISPIEIPLRDDPVRLDRRGAELREPEPLADDDLGFRERTVGLAVHEPAGIREVGAQRLVQDRRAVFERALGIHHGGQRLVVDLHQLGRVLGEVAIARDDDRDRFAHEPRLVGGGAVVMDGPGHADRERLRALRDIGARHDAHDAGRLERRRDVVPADASVRVRRAHDRDVVRVADGQIVDVRAAARQQSRVLDAGDGLADPAVGRLRGIAHA
jgi:hypothetical protein